jgi:hypothetical protein
MVTNLENKVPAEAQECTFRQKFTSWQQWCVFVWESCRDEGSSRLQFSFALESPSFSDGPGIQDNIFEWLWHQAIQILCKLPRGNKKKWWPLSWFFIYSCELSSVLEIVTCAIPHAGSWFQGRILKTKIRRLLWPDKENLVTFLAIQAFLPKLRSDVLFDHH